MIFQQKNILVAPLNWGLGHATRCIPIIRALQQNGFNPIIASDGEALQLLKLEFPELTILELPSYKISYPKNGFFFRWKMFLSLSNIGAAVAKEQKIIEKWIDEFQITGIISDNRLGVCHAKVPSVYITHQLNVLTGLTTFFSTKIHQKFIKKFTECWVPDVENVPNLSGKLSHFEQKNLNVKYIGPLSRFSKTKSDKKYDYFILLSGPEPQRTLLEQKLISEFKEIEKPVIFVKGKMEAQQKIHQEGAILFYNYMTTTQLEDAFSSSELVICRSGYTSIMDLAHLEKKAFFIPTPGQFEQEYLAVKFQKEKLVPFANQQDFKLQNLSKISDFKGFSSLATETDWCKLFSLFQGK